MPPRSWSSGPKSGPYLAAVALRIGKGETDGEQAAAGDAAAEGDAEAGLPALVDLAREVVAAEGSVELRGADQSCAGVPHAAAPPEVPSRRLVAYSCSAASRACLALRGLFGRLRGLIAGVGDRVSA